MIQSKTCREAVGRALRRLGGSRQPPRHRRRCAVDSLEAVDPDGPLRGGGQGWSRATHTACCAGKLHGSRDPDLPGEGAEGKLRSDETGRSPLGGFVSGGTSPPFCIQSSHAAKARNVKVCFLENDEE